MSIAKPKALPGCGSAHEVDDDPELELQDFFAREGARLRSYLAVLVGGRDAEDLAQEVFVRARRARTTSEVRAVGPWVRQIARHVAIDHLRRSTATRALLERSDLEACGEGEGTGPDPERSAVQQQMRGCIVEFVRRLPERDAEVIALAELRGLPDQEVASALGVTLGAAKIRLHRARARLRSMMESGCELSRDEGGLACDRKQREG